MAKIIKGKFPAKQKKNPAATYQLKITLLYSEPLIWRCIEVPGSMTLDKLHDVIQLSMGWTDSHLHQFMIGNSLYALKDEEDDWGGPKSLDETKFKICDLEADMQQHFMYEYDFGDGWRHEIQIEKVISTDETPLKHPVLVAGERACPPEDIGGIPGYEDFLEAISNPENEEHQEMLDWYGSDDFDPDFFEKDGINKILKKME